jgi:hypothetical protein
MMMLMMTKKSVVARLSGVDYDIAIQRTYIDCELPGAYSTSNIYILQNKKYWQGNEDQKCRKTLVDTSERTGYTTHHNLDLLNTP